MRTRRKHPTDEKLLDAVLPVVAQSGVGDVTMDGLAAAAGVSKQTMYAHFGSKDALLERLLSREFEHLRAKVDDAAATFPADDADPLRVIRGRIEPAYAYAFERPDGARLLLDPRAPDAGMRVHRLVADAVTRGLAEIGVDPDDRALADTVRVVLPMAAAAAIAGTQAALVGGIDQTRALDATVAFVAAGVWSVLGAND
ncbi:MAG: TetR/AcrR family transcriptional regulator [Solirubrobacteraceae bacterium]|nr:TetR/AcrR family transcriptional regulator [Solirubrobacteraceae bacterium]